MRHFFLYPLFFLLSTMCRPSSVEGYEVVSEKEEAELVPFLQNDTNDALNEDKTPFDLIIKKKPIFSRKKILCCLLFLLLLVPFHFLLEQLFPSKGEVIINPKDLSLSVTLSSFRISGWGNIDRGYYFWRSVAYWHNYTFRTTFSGYGDFMYWVFARNKLVHYFPQKVPQSGRINQEFLRNLSADPEIKQVLALTSDRLPITEIGISHLPKDESLFLFYNRFFVSNVIIPETEEALKKFFERRKHKYSEDEIAKRCNVGIHFRCGDAIAPGRIFITLPYIQYSINKLFERANRTDCLAKKKEQTMFLFSQISKKGIHLYKRDGRNLPKCREIMAFVKESLERAYPAYRVLVPDIGLEDTFYMMTKLPFMICGDSTMCLMGAMSNGNMKVAIPSDAQWHIPSEKRYLLPEDHLIVDLQDTFYVPTESIAKDPKLFLGMHNETNNNTSISFG